MIARLIGGVPRRALILLALFALVTLLAPLVAGDYLLTVFILMLYFAFTGQAWNIMMGFAGQLSLGHALYVGLGAYTTAILFVRYGIPPWIGFLVAAPIAMAVGGAMGFLAFRFRVGGVYFAILTIAFAEFARIGFDHFAWVNGSAGLFLPVAQFTHNDLWRLRGSPMMFYYVMLAATMLAFIGLPAAAQEPARLLLAGHPRRRAGGARGRDQRLPLQDDRGGDLGRHDVVCRRVLCVLLQQPVPRADLQHFALDRDHPRAAGWRRRHFVWADLRHLYS